MPAPLMRHIEILLPTGTVQPSEKAGSGITDLSASGTDGSTKNRASSGVMGLSASGVRSSPGSEVTYTKVGHAVLGAGVFYIKAGTAYLGSRLNNGSGIAGFSASGTREVAFERAGSGVLDMRALEQRDRLEKSGGNLHPPYGAALGEPYGEGDYGEDAYGGGGGEGDARRIASGFALIVVGTPIQPEVTITELYRVGEVRILDPV